MTGENAQQRYEHMMRTAIARNLHKLSAFVESGGKWVSREVMCNWCGMQDRELQYCFTAANVPRYDHKQFRTKMYDASAALKALALWSGMRQWA
ncbi:hypothetical protein BLEM_0595 [Bifidobacterium lemurum]|uniref:Uncharacterized protein n=1 Tax=Bifidobacterium lemurum TaxID=1603886 RepID=A0A261FU85_9BIFI|nr:hypothetical protein [Bifidobacterium lemurum]OZG62678.1 hypothetical protein BLEM_0595 [Bifidobacterium lemurum]QOL34605.1 hypothetical protein BL8807_01325 [Bifidobacterium lemurum]